MTNEEYREYVHTMYKENFLDKGKKQPYIRIYDHRIAMMMTLYGDFSSYIESIK